MVLQSFNGTTVSARSESGGSNYWLLVGHTAVVVQDRASTGIEADRVLVQFACDVAGMGLACHNAIPNALWVRRSDLGPSHVAVAVGDVFSMDVGELVGLCRVIASESPRGAWDANGRWRVLSCDWVGRRAELATALTLVETFAPLRLRRLKGRLHVQSIGGPPPPDFQRVGVHLPDVSERRLRSPTNPGGWEWVRHQLSAELEYRTDPAHFEARSKKSMREARAAAATQAKERAAARLSRPGSLAPHNGELLSALGLEVATTLATGAHSPGFLSAVRAALQSMAGELRDAKSVPEVVSLLKETTVALNRIDATHGHAVMTPDAEELVEALVGLCAAAGLDEDFAAQTIDELRDF